MRASRIPAACCSATAECSIVSTRCSLPRSCPSTSWWPSVRTREAPTLSPMKRVAVLGSTGSIGRQALEVIDAHPGLELVAASSGSQPIDGLAPLTQVGGDPTELLDQAEPDVVLNAVVGFAGVS